MWQESGDPPKGEKPAALRTGLTTGSCATACCVAAAICAVIYKGAEAIPPEIRINLIAPTRFFLIENPTVGKSMILKVSLENTGSIALPLIVL